MGTPPLVCELTAAAQRELEPNRLAPRAAREFLREHLCEHAEGAADDASLIVSELVTNAISYAGPPLLIKVECVGERRLWISVHDGSTDFAPTTRASEFADGFLSPDGEDLLESGRGLRLLRSLASAWGVEPSASGKSIWFEMAC